MLGDRPLRLGVSWDHPLGFALEKPVGVQVLADNWYPRIPVLTEAINYQVANGKGEMERLGLVGEGARAIFQLEPAMAGFALFAKDGETGLRWSNDYGSGLFTLTIRFLSAKAPPGVETMDCDLPIARHGGRENRMLVTHRTGKKTETRFRRLEQFGRYTLWEATTHYLRMHQIQLHAFEVGLGVVGDSLYAVEAPFYLSSVKRGFRPKGDAQEEPLYDGPAMYLAGATFPLAEGAGEVSIAIDPPKRFTAILRNLERYL